MSEAPSIAGAVQKLYARSLAWLALTIVLVGTAVGFVVVVRRDDADAFALARTLGSEISAHARDTPEALDRLVRIEVDEEAWFHRTTEVFRGSRRIGGTAATSRLARQAAGATGCHSGHLEDGWNRICVAQIDPSTRIVVATPIGPLIRSVSALAESVALVAFLSVVAMVLVARRVVASTLRPLSSFEARIADIPALGGQRRVGTRWGAEEIDTLAATFDGLLTRIDDAVSREQRFVADASHELRTPITRLRAQLELAAETDGTATNGEARERVALALRTCEELSHTTEVLLALARQEIDLGDAVDLGDVAREAMARFTASDRARVVASFGEGVIVRGEEALLVLAFVNVLDNALKYSSARVDVRVTDGDSRCLFVVEDRGSGIPDSDLDHVRRRFVRGTSRPPGVRGAGLGLAFVDHVATLHDGALGLENVPTEGGLRVTLSLPTWAPHPHAHVRGERRKPSDDM